MDPKGRCESQRSISPVLTCATAGIRLDTRVYLQPPYPFCPRRPASTKDSYTTSRTFAASSSGCTCCCCSAAKNSAAERIASTSTPAPMEPSKPATDDRIAPVGTAYEPVKLATPGKLSNRWNPGGAQQSSPEAPSTGGSIKDRMAAFSGAGATSPSAPQPSGKKLTWSERQAETKRQKEEEEKSSSAAGAAGECFSIYRSYLIII